MKRRTKWIVGLLSALILAVPAFFALLIWRDFHVSRVRQEREAVSAVAQFHKRFNAGEFDKICDDAFACPDSADLRQAWHSVLHGVRSRAGAFKSVVKPEVIVFIEPPSVRADTVSSFEKGEIEEIFVMRHPDEGCLKIVTYQTVTKEEPPSSR
jgi:hypothetical protein